MWLLMSDRLLHHWIKIRWWKSSLMLILLLHHRVLINENTQIILAVVQLILLERLISLDLISLFFSYIRVLRYLILKISLAPSTVRSHGVNWHIIAIIPSCRLIWVLERLVLPIELPIRGRAFVGTFISWLGLSASFLWKTKVAVSIHNLISITYLSS